ncbi:MAG: hypothetical protein IMW98_08650 [Firmicutes bacterium]|nr:hypothetical protein [Bacillota bacterium]MBE3590875.1 hypothetical protein [Bacillota bacterium]
MFNRAFFEEDLYKLLAHYSSTHETHGPVVELKVADGSVYKVKAKVVATDDWVTLEVWESEDAREPVQLTLPYGAVMQVKIYPTDPDEEHIGFRRE